MKGHRSTRPARLVAGSMGLLLLGMVLVTTMAVPAGATIFTSSGAITIPSGAPATTTGPADPYPSTISVSGLTGTIVDVNVRLLEFSHQYPDNVDILLVGPAGQKLQLMTDVGGMHAVSGLTIWVNDAAGSFMPDSDDLADGHTSRTYKPTQGTVCGSCGFNGPAPAPVGPYATALSVFNGANPNGTWRLYVYDDSASETGSISSWSVDIVTNGPSIASFSPTSGPPGALVGINGSNFTGTTSVTFGGAPALFAVISATHIHATVPSNAVTGPISVTTPNGTATSSTNFTVTPAPTITSFVPKRGQVGATVVVTGTGFTGATSVAFDGTAATFTVDSDTQITATVPAGASGGPISVTTPGGTGTSLTNFVVQHARSVSLTLGRRATGTVTVVDGFGACASDVLVRVQHLDGAVWRTITTVLTKASGNYSAGGVSESGTYRAVARAAKLSSGDRCMKAISPTATR